MTEHDRSSYEAEVEYWKSLYRSEKKQKEDARSAWNELCEALEDAHMANSALTDERDALKAELARQGDAQAALMSLAKKYNSVWNERNSIAAMYHQAIENAQRAQEKIAMLESELSAELDTSPRMYEHFVPSCIYPARRCRRRVYQYYSRLQQHRWSGGIAQRELLALAKHEGLYATHRELARLRIYAADWDDMAEQMEHDSYFGMPF